MKREKLLLLFVAGLTSSILFAQLSSKEKINRIWAVDDGEKIKQEDITNILAEDYEKNKVWDGQKICLSGAANEIIAFQLIIEAGSEGAESVNVILPELKNENYVITNSSISEGDPYDYRDKRIEMFVEAYQEIKGRTKTGFIWWDNDRPMPDEDYIGMMPDALIPFETVPSKGGAPFNIQTEKNQGVWIDIYIPKDCPGGIYSGTATITIGENLYKEIPLELKVYNFILPDETHLHNFFHCAGNYHVGLTYKHRAKHSLNDPDYNLLEGRYCQMAHRHRMDLSFKASLTDIDNHYKRYIIGDYFSYHNKYDGPGIMQYQTTYSIETYGCPGSFSPDTEEGWHIHSDAWVNWFEENAPNTEYFKYLYDEPKVELYDKIKERADWVHNNPGPGKRLKLYKTGIMDPSLYGYVDYWSLAGHTGYFDNVNPWYEAGGKSGYQPKLAAERRLLGEKVGIYNGCRPSYGTGFIIDAPANEFRVNAWIMWKYHVDQYFYWYTTYWSYSDENKTARNVFKDPDTNLKPDGFSNGDGWLFYPGEQKDFPNTEDDKSLFGPIASIRMKSWRRGVQDYEYLWLAKQAGINSDEIVNKIVPHAFDEWKVSKTFYASWPDRGYKYEDARRELAEMMESNSVGVEKKTGISYCLYEAFPNPFNPSTAIKFSIPKKAFVSLKIFDILGREVAELLTSETEAGEHTVRWDASNMTSGVYFCHLNLEKFSSVKKIILLK
ncbi:MAG: DUF4091 domain-containing protein [Ignavibacteria bacterium]|nr:DUF4091 domain-containing protein [Ignavibacteria bacterium]